MMQRTLPRGATPLLLLKEVAMEDSECPWGFPLVQEVKEETGGEHIP